MPTVSNKYYLRLFGRQLFLNLLIGLKTGEIELSYRISSNFCLHIHSRISNQIKNATQLGCSGNLVPPPPPYPLCTASNVDSNRYHFWLIIFLLHLLLLLFVYNWIQKSAREKLFKLFAKLEFRSIESAAAPLRLGENFR